MARGVLTIEQQCTDAVEAVLDEYGPLEDVQVRRFNDTAEVDSARLITVAPMMAESSALDPHGGTLWEWSARLTISTATVDDEDGTGALDVLALVRDCVYGSTFIGDLNAHLDGLAVRAVQLVAATPDETEDNLNQHAVELRVKLQTTC